MLVWNGAVCDAGRNARKRNQTEILGQMQMNFKHGASVCLSGDIQLGFWQRGRDGPLHEFKRKEEIMLK